MKGKGMRVKSIYAASLVVLAVYLAVAFASEDGGVEDSEAGDELQDLQTIASQMDITLDEATERYGWHDDFSRMVSSIRAAHPGDFTSARITGDAEAVIMFMGQVPSGARAAVDDFMAATPGINVRFREGMGLNEQEIENAVAGAHYAVYGSPFTKDVSTSFDIESRRIDITVQIPGTPPQTVLDELRQRAEKGAVEATRPDLLDVVSVSLVAVGHDLGGKDSGANKTAGNVMAYP